MSNGVLVANSNAYQLQAIVFKQFFTFLFANKDYMFY